VIGPASAKVAISWLVDIFDSWQPLLKTHKMPKIPHSRKTLYEVFIFVDFTLILRTKIVSAFLKSSQTGSRKVFSFLMMPHRSSQSRLL
jgi:hypothetical protein